MKRPTIRDILARPALNGGWDKLARQQDAQSRDIRLIRKKVKALMVWRLRWDRRWKILLGLVGSTTVAIVAKVLVEILVRAKVVP